MALTKYIYTDIQPEIAEIFPDLHIDNEKLISLFKKWGFNIIINDSISWKLILEQDNGYAISFNKPQAIKIKKPHKYVDQIIFKNIDKTNKQEQNTIEGDYILVTDEKIYLSEISYRMDATNAYLWSTYNNIGEKTHTEVNLLKNLRFNLDTEHKVNNDNRAETISTNPSVTQTFLYSRNSKYGFNGYLGNFINLKYNTITNPNTNVRGQHNYSQNKYHQIEKGQFWGTESNQTVYEVLWDQWKGASSISLSYDAENDVYTIDGKSFYLPGDVKLVLIKKDDIYQVISRTLMSYRDHGTLLGKIENLNYWNKTIYPSRIGDSQIDGYGVPMVSVSLARGGDGPQYKSTSFIRPSLTIKDISDFAYAEIPIKQNINQNLNSFTWTSGLPEYIEDQETTWSFNETITIPAETDIISNLPWLGGGIEFARWEDFNMGLTVHMKSFNFLTKTSLDVTAQNDIYYATFFSLYSNKIHNSNIDWNILLNTNYPIRFSSSIYSDEIDNKKYINITNGDISKGNQYAVYHGTERLPYKHKFPYSPSDSKTYATPSINLTGMDLVTFDVIASSSPNTSRSPVILIAVREPISTRLQ